jgi:hypothetical protein
MKQLIVHAPPNMDLGVTFQKSGTRWLRTGAAGQTTVHLPAAAVHGSSTTITLITRYAGGVSDEAVITVQGHASHKTKKRAVRR